MNKLLAVVLVFFALAVALLGFNFYTRCSTFGGVVGLIQQCRCLGAEIVHPLDTLETVQGFSSTMCLGLQLPNANDSIVKSKDSKCYEKIESGPCLTAFPAYQYNQINNSCEKGVWGGCNGNVPFKTESSCKQTCVD